MTSVRYIDRSVESSFPYYWEKVNIIEKCFAKGDSFKWEKELRLLHIDPYNGDEEPKSGVLVKVDLCSLIDEIYVSPAAESWFASAVEDLVRRYEVGNEKVKISDALQRTN